MRVCTDVGAAAIIGGEHAQNMRICSRALFIDAVHPRWWCTKNIHTTHTLSHIYLRQSARRQSANKSAAEKCTSRASANTTTSRCCCCGGDRGRADLATAAAPRAPREWHVVPPEREREGQRGGTRTRPSDDDGDIITQWGTLPLRRIAHIAHCILAAWWLAVGLCVACARVFPECGRRVLAFYATQKAHKYVVFVYV